MFALFSSSALCSSSVSPASSLSCRRVVLSTADAWLRIARRRLMRVSNGFVIQTTNERREVT